MHPLAEPFCPRCDRPRGSDAEWRCSSCGGPFDLPRWSEPAPTWPRAGEGLWRYADWLGVETPVRLGEARTPLVELAWPPFESPVNCKLEGVLPTGSFKDRGMAVAVSRLRSLGAPGVAIDSSGNAGAALAAYAASVELPCRVFAPETASPAKLAQIRAYGAEVVLVPGPRTRTTERALEELGDYLYGSHMWDPYFLVGTQTFAFELVEQLGGAVPHAVVVPLGAGTLLLGAYLGFDALRSAGLADRIPRLYGIQVDACAPLAGAFGGGAPEAADVPCEPSVAEGVLIARPPRARAVLNAVRTTGGSILSVSDAEVIASLSALAGRGIYAEPTSALGVAGLGALVRAGILDPQERVVVALTGHGLKAGHVFERLA